MAIIVKGTVKIARPIVPTDIAGLTLWLDASDSTTLFQNSDGTTPATADSDPIGYWGDKSGKGNNVVQSVTLSKSLLKKSIQNGKDIVRFDGVNDFLKSTTGGGNSNITLFFVNIARGNPGHQMVFSMGEESNGRRRCLWLEPSSSTIRFNGYHADVSSSLSWTIGTANISQFKNDFNAISLAKNNSAWTTPTAPVIVAYSATNITIGRNNGTTEPFNGDVCEVVYYNTVIPDVHRTSILNYLNTKWGVY